MVASAFSELLKTQTCIRMQIRLFLQCFQFPLSTMQAQLLAQCRKGWVGFAKDIQKVEEVGIRGSWTGCQGWSAERGTESEVLMGIYKNKRHESIILERRNEELSFSICNQSLIFVCQGYFSVLIHACGLWVRSWSTCTLLTKELLFNTVSKVIPCGFIITIILPFPFISSLLP